MTTLFHPIQQDQILGNKILRVWLREKTDLSTLVEKTGTKMFMREDWISLVFSLKQEGREKGTNFKRMTDLKDTHNLIRTK